MRNEKFYANMDILSRKFTKCSPGVKKAFCSNMYSSTMWYNYTVTRNINKK